MPRIVPLSSPYPPDVQAAFDKIMPAGVEPLVLFRTPAVNERVYQRLTAGGLLDRGLLTLRQREIVIDRTCALSRCEYEWGVHIALFAAKAKLTPEQITATVTGGDAGWSAGERALLDVCQELDATRHISDALWQRLSAHFAPEQILEIIALIGFYRMVSLQANALRLPPEPFAIVVPQLEHISELIGGVLRQWQVRLVDHQHVGNLQHAGLHRLHVVAHVGRIHHDAHVGDLGDFRFGLAGADRLQDHDLAAGSVHDIYYPMDTLGQSAQMTARCHGADEDARIFRMPPHPHAVAEDGAAENRTRRIDGGDRNSAALRAERGDCGVDQRRLPRTRRAGETDHCGPAGFGNDAPVDVVGGAAARFNHADATRECPGIAGAKSLDDIGAGRIVRTCRVRQRQGDVQSRALRAAAGRSRHA
jgi:alkylhydroperoxidase family enzyme